MIMIHFFILTNVAEMEENKILKDSPVENYESEIIFKPRANRFVRNEIKGMVLQTIKQLSFASLRYSNYSRKFDENDRFLPF